MQSEVDRRVSEVEAVADAFAIMAHRTDSAEYLLAGLRDAGGPDLGPRQACHLSVTMTLLGVAASARGLSGGDVDFAYQMLGRFMPGWNSREDAWYFVSGLGPVTKVHLREQESLFEEMALLARSQRDELNADLLSRGFANLRKAFETPWTEESNRQRLAQRDAVTVTPRLRPAEPASVTNRPPRSSTALASPAPSNVADMARWMYARDGEITEAGALEKQRWWAECDAVSEKTSRRLAGAWFIVVGLTVFAFKAIGWSWGKTLIASLVLAVALFVCFGLAVARAHNAKLREFQALDSVLQEVAGLPDHEFQQVRRAFARREVGRKLRKVAQMGVRVWAGLT